MLYLFYQPDWNDQLTYHFIEFNNKTEGFDEEGARQKIQRQIAFTKACQSPAVEIVENVDTDL